MGRRALPLVALAMGLALALTACNPLAVLANPRVAGLVGRLLITVVRNEQVQVFVDEHLGDGAAAALETVSVVGEFALGQVGGEDLPEGSQYLVVNHLVDDEPRSTVVRILDTGPLVVQVDGRADLYYFEDGRRVIDTLPYASTQITVYNPEAGGPISSSGEVDGGFRGAFDLDTGTGLAVDDLRYPPTRADVLLSDDGAAEPRLINGAAAVARGDLLTTPESCAAIPAPAWRDELAAEGHGSGDPAWCVRTAEDARGVVRLRDDGLFGRVYSYELWAG